MLLIFGWSTSNISENRFKSYDWFDFYKDAEEAIPAVMPEPRGLPMSSSLFVDADLAGDKRNRRSQTGILIFCNKALIHWYSKLQPTVETSTFGIEFRALKIAVELTETPRYKLSMFGEPLDDPTSMCCDNETVHKYAALPESALNKTPLNYLP